MARRSIISIINEINDLLEVGLSWSNNVFYGIAVLQPRDDGGGTKTWPMTRLDLDQEGQRIYPDDTKNLKIYHRIVAQENGPIQQGKGTKNFNDVIYTMRLVAVGYRPNIRQQAWWDNPQIAEEIMAIMSANTRLQDGVIMNTEGQVITDKLTVFNEEYQNNEDIKQWILRLYGVAITYTIRQRTVGNGC